MERKSRCNRAWLITWLGAGRRIDEANRIAAIVSARRSKQYVADLIELLYEFAATTTGGCVRSLNRPRARPYRAQQGDLINDVPHGDRIECGHNPWLFGQIVSELEVREDIERGVEIIRWREPSRFRWKDESKLAVVVDEPGRVQTLIRPLSKTILDRAPYS